MESKQLSEIAESGNEIQLTKSIPWEMGWLAIGNHGTLLKVQPDGSIQNIDTGSCADFKDICYDGQSLWIVGTEGCVLKGNQELLFTAIPASAEEDFYACQYYFGNIYCGGSGGVLWMIDDADVVKPCNVRFAGKMVDIEASKENCLFITDESEIISTNDGVNWTSVSYEEYYGKRVAFQGIIHDGHSFWAYGITDAGTELFYSGSGAVWGERNINYLDGADVDLSDLQILSMATDGSQLYAWCKGGIMLTIPDCVKCNKKTEIAEVQGGTIGYNGGNLLLISDESNLEVIKTELAKQYQISAETTNTKLQEGAILIDVRNQEEYDKKHIRGSVLIPLEELEEKLPKLYPDMGQTVIFYCTKGVRSQTAVEKAVSLGYVDVYSLGSIEDWIYDFEERQ